MKKILIVETTKDERQRIIDEAIAIGILDAPAPSERLNLVFQEYIDGRRELADIQKEVISWQ